MGKGLLPDPRLCESRDSGWVSSTQQRKYHGTLLRGTAALGLGGAPSTVGGRPVLAGSRGCHLLLSLAG